MNILVIGGGAREHTICDAIIRSNISVDLYSVMNNINPGIHKLSNDYLKEKETNVTRIIDYAIEKKIDLAIIGPEAPLEVGIVDELIKNGINTCSPSKSAARIETDKEWMRNLLKKYDIHGQLKFASFSDLSKAERFINDLNGEIVIKPIGLTGGKGVRVSGDHFNGINESLDYVQLVLNEKIGGKSRVLIEEKALGEEFTLQAFSDGITILPLPAVQDHKRLLPNDKGPNTGGMGSYSCANGLLPFLNKGDYEEGAVILQNIVEALNKERCPYIGPIYGQFMLTSDGPKIIEINARFGDPEVMNILPLLETDFIELCLAIMNENLNSKNIRMKKKSSVCKYVVPQGYGIKSIAGERVIVNENSIRNVGSRLFYASVDMKNDKIFTTSSRSLAIVGFADEIYQAEKICELALDYIKGDHIFIRHDIGTEELIEKRVTHMNKILGI